MSNDYVRFLGRPPSLFYKWGLFGLFLLFIIGVVISFKIEVPKKVRTVAEVTAPEASSPIVAKHRDIIKEVYFFEGSYVNEGDVLFRLDSEADYRDVITLETWLNTTDSSGSRAPLPKNLSLGSGQLDGVYKALWLLLELEEQGQDSLYLTLKKQGIKDQILEEEGATEEIRREQEICNALIRDYKNQLADWEKRLKDSLVSEQAVEPYRIQVKEKQAECARVSRSLKDKKVLIKGLQREIFNLEAYASTEKAEKRTNEILECENLRSAIKSWKERYLISAKSTGLLTLSNEDLLGSVIMQNEVIGEILNEGAEAQVYAYVPISSMDEIDLGQEVQVIIDGFSLREYGKLEGKVSGIRPTLEEDKMHQRIEISLNNGFTTSKGKTIEYRPAYRAEAIVITERSPILFRLFEELRPS